MKKLFALFILAASAAFVNAQSLTLQHVKTNITCYGARNGSVNLTVSGGTSPYTFLWSNGATTEDISSLSPSYYGVTVTDAASNTATNGVTLTEPSQITFQFTLSDYIVNGTHYHLSSFDWHNGFINSSVSGGVPGYTYSWSNSTATTANISSLDAGTYKLTVTDASGCTRMSESIVMTKPDKLSWGMTGNSGTNPSTQFIGTTDAQDLKFKTNNQLQFKLGSNGDINFPSLSGTGNKMIYADNNGNLISKVISISDIALPGLQCADPPNPFAWRHKTGTSPNVIYTCTDRVGIGTDNPHEYLEIGNQFTFHSGGSKVISFNSFYDGNRRRITSDPVSALHFHVTGALEFQTLVGGGSPNDIINTGMQSRFYIDVNGSVGIGTTSPATGFKLDVNGPTKTTGLETSTLKVTTGAASGNVLQSDGTGNASWAVPSLGNHSASQNLKLNGYWLSNDGGNEGIRINDNGNVGIGSINPPVETFQIGDLLTFHSSGTQVIGYNFYYDGADKRISTGGVATIGLDNAAINFSTAPSGSAGTIYDLTSKLYIKNNGNVGIGTTSVEDKLQVNGGASKFLIGSAGSANLDYGTSYIGFNAARTASGWNMTTDQVHNGGATIWGTINGDMYFSTIPNSATSTADQTKSDAEILSNARLKITNVGNIGIGTTSPSGFQNGFNQNVNVLYTHLKGITPTLRLENTYTANGNIASDFVITSANGFGRFISDKGIVFFINADPAYTGPNNFFTIIKNHSSWSVTPTDEEVLFKVNNDGRIFSRSAQVTVNGFPDFVFDEGYQLQSLEEVDNYVKENKHLPGIPTACEVEENGLDVGEMIKKQMQKIEELTLYVIELKKENNNLQERIGKLENK